MKHNPREIVRHRMLRPSERGKATQRVLKEQKALEALATTATGGKVIWRRNGDGTWQRAIGTKHDDFSKGKRRQVYLGEDWTFGIPESEVPPEIVERIFLEWQRLQPVEKPAPPPRAKPSPVQLKATKLQADLTRWQRRLKLALTKVKKLTAKARRFDSRHGTNIAPERKLPK